MAIHIKVSLTKTYAIIIRVQGVPEFFYSDDKPVNSLIWTFKIYYPPEVSSIKYFC